MTIITGDAISRRRYWITEIQKLSGSFGNDFSRVESELSAELERGGLDSLLDHLRLCGDIPENYEHDSSEEKLYSKYTDALLYESFKALTLKSIVLKERGDSADVEAYAEDYSFVADAKAFRLSRTAKNQKDFKVQAMDGWKRGKPFAMVVCPIYQLPTRASQIYEQASARNVCILTYSHLAVLCTFAKKVENSQIEHLVHEVFKAVSLMNPSKDSIAYWQTVNRAIFNRHPIMKELWKIEKQAAVESISIAKELALEVLSAERERIMRMPHQKALEELLRIKKIDSRITTIKGVTDTGLLTHI